jgi:hypothetical protein
MFIDESSDGQSRYDYLNEQTEVITPSIKTNKRRVAFSRSTPQAIRDQWLKQLDNRATRQAAYQDHSLFDHVNEVLFG